MIAIQFIGRMLWAALQSPYVQDTLSNVGRKVVRDASAQLIRRINSETKRRTAPTIR